MSEAILPAERVAMAPSPAIRPLAAVKSFRKLVEDKEDTEQVFEIMAALAGKSFHNGYQRMLKSDAGGRQAYLREELADRLQDHDWLRTLPEGSVGAAYLAFCGERDLSAYGLAAESAAVADEGIEAAHPNAWYARRVRDIHDIWHVLTGYATDALGEVCVVAFSYAQTQSTGFALIAGGAALEFERLRKGHPYAKAVWQAYRHGREAEWLPAQDYEALLSENLGDARKRLKIRKPTFYEAVPKEGRNGYKFN